MTKNSDVNSSRVQEFITDNISPYFIRIKERRSKIAPIEERIIEVDMERETKRNI